MADGIHQTAPPEAAHHPLPTAEETEIPPESASELPLPSKPGDVRKDSEAPTELPLPVEEKLIETGTPLEPPPPRADEHIAVTATEEKSATPVSIAGALAVPEQSESPKTPSKLIDKRKAPESLASFKEESNKVSDLSNYERKALQEFRFLVQEALNNRLFTGDSPSEKAGLLLSEEISIWGVPLLKDDRSDVILLKFLRARDFKVSDSFFMLKNTIKWRKDFNVDELMNEDLGDDLEKVVCMHGRDKEGHPVCYNVYGEFQNKVLYAKTFSDEEKRSRFLRWRIQFLERRIRKLDFNPGGINTIFQVSDLTNLPGPGKKELRSAMKQALQILQDNYPEFVAKQVFINVPWWHLAFYTTISPFLTQRTKSKFVFAGPTRTAETLFKYIFPEQVPTQYGGLSVDLCGCNPNFTLDDPATEITVKPATKQTVEIIIHEKCTIVWELRVIGWEVCYSAEYVPQSGYTVVIQKSKKMTRNHDEAVVSDSFDVSELGKILLTVDNSTSKKKKLLYRYKATPYAA